MNKTLGNSKKVGTPGYLSRVVPLRKVGDEAVHKELGDRIERAATTASSSEAECQNTILGDVDAQTRFETTSKQSNDPPLSKVKTFGSGEDNMKILEWMAIVHKCLHWEGTRSSGKVTPLFDTMMVQDSQEVGEDRGRKQRLLKMRLHRRKKQVLDLEKAKSDQAIEIACLKKRVEKLERRRKFRTIRLKRLKKVDLDADDEVTLVNETQERQDEELMFDTGVLDGDEIAAPTIPVSTATIIEETLAKTLMEIKVTLDEQMARDLQAQLEAELIKEERKERQKEEEANIALIESWENT
ncbi:hypothetical protein Tco_0469813 [Tanacetum coccineum]